MNSTPVVSSGVPPPCFTCQPAMVACLFALLFALIIILGVLGNAFVVSVILSDRKLRSSSVNLFLLNLAVADLGNLVFCSPDAFQVLYDKGWILPGVLCPLLRFLQEYFLYASVLLQMSIGIERFMAICSPLSMQRFTMRTTIYILVSAWLIAGIFATPYMMYQGIIFHRFNFCFWKNITARTRSLFKYAEFTVLYAIPLILLTVLYTVMGRVLWGKEGGNNNIANEAQQEAILRLRRSVVKMLIISMLLYFICYSPIQVIFIMETFFHHHIYLPPWIRLMLNALSVSSSSANPIVYIVCCRHFRTRFSSMLALIGRACRPAYDVVDGEKSVASTIRSITRSPYVSFRKSCRRELPPQQHSVTLL